MKNEGGKDRRGFAFAWADILLWVLTSERLLAFMGKCQCSTHAGGVGQLSGYGWRTTRSKPERGGPWLASWDWTRNTVNASSCRTRLTGWK